MLLNRGKVVGIIQARMTSTRLPGKILREVMGKPLLEYQIERLRRVPEIDELIVATTTNREDDPVIALCERLGVKTFHGSESDVLSRYYIAAKQAGAAAVVRFTSDCPLIDPEIASAIINEYLNRSDELDYVGIDHESISRGMDTEAFAFAALERAYNEGDSQPAREHVTWYIHQNRDKFRVAIYRSPVKQNIYRLTVDTPEDYRLVNAVLTALYPSNPHFSLQDVVTLLDAHPELATLNSEIKQKTI